MLHLIEKSKLLYFFHTEVPPQSPHRKYIRKNPDRLEKLRRCSANGVLLVSQTRSSSRCGTTAPARVKVYDILRLPAPAPLSPSCFMERHCHRIGMSRQLGVRRVCACVQASGGAATMLASRVWRGLGTNLHARQERSDAGQTRRRGSHTLWPLRHGCCVTRYSLSDAALGTMASRATSSMLVTLPRLGHATMDATSALPASKGTVSNAQATANATTSAAALALHPACPAAPRPVRCIRGVATVPSPPWIHGTGGLRQGGSAAKRPQTRASRNRGDRRDGEFRALGGVYDARSRSQSTTTVGVRAGGFEATATAAHRKWEGAAETLSLC